MIVIKSKAEIEKIRLSCQLAASILVRLSEMIKPGLRLLDLENAAIKMMSDCECISAFKGYNGFPAHICTSVNDVVVHGVPTEYALFIGDIVSLDVGVLKDGYYGDVAGTFPVGNIAKEDERLLSVTKDSLLNAISYAKHGNHLSDISFAVESVVSEAGFSVVKDFVGHGIGQQLHEDPQIPNYGPPHKGPVLREGMVLAIEPMVNAGTYRVRIAKDKWTTKTLDGLKSAHFEHTVAVTKDAPDVLTKFNGL